MKIERYERDGVNFITLTNKVGLSVSFSDIGAGIYAIVYQGRLMTVTPQSVADYAHNGNYYGLTVGRMAGRVENGLIQIGEKTYKMDQNEGPTCLHSGKDTFAFRRFAGSVQEYEESAVVSYDILSENGDQGLPGEISFSVNYEVDEETAKIRVRYWMHLNNGDLTLVNPTNHSYFNLGESSIEKLRLTIPATKVMTYDKILIPQGWEDIRGSLDFRKEKEIGRDINDPKLYETNTHGYDHCFLFEDGMNKPLVLESDTIRMSVSANAPCVQIYSSNYPDTSRVLLNGAHGALHDGLAIEPVGDPYDRTDWKLTNDHAFYREFTYRFETKGAN